MKAARNTRSTRQAAPVSKLIQDENRIPGSSEMEIAVKAAAKSPAKRVRSEPRPGPVDLCFSIFFRPQRGNYSGIEITITSALG